MSRKKRIKKTSFHSDKYLILAVSAVIIAALVAGKTFVSSFLTSETRDVLGIMRYLAKDGDDSSGSGSSGSGSSGGESSGSSGSGSESSESGSSGSGGSSGSNGSSSSSGFGSSDSGSSGSGSGTGGGTTETRIIDPITGVRTEEEIKQDEQRTEIRLSETERIKTRTKDGRTRIDITAGGVKTRLEIRDDRVVVKAEQEDGTEVELEDDIIFKIEDRLATSQIKVATDSANRLVIQRGVIGAVSQFPLSIDLATNTLIVNTPAGERNVTVLPDQAVQNLIVANVVNRLGGGVVVNAIRTGEVSTLDQVVTLGERNGVPIYEINGLSDQRLLGIIPVTIEKTVDVSAETGAVLSSHVSFIGGLLDIVSF